MAANNTRYHNALKQNTEKPICLLNKYLTTLAKTLKVHLNFERDKALITIYIYIHLPSLLIQKQNREENMFQENVTWCIICDLSGHSCPLMDH